MRCSPVYEYHDISVHNFSQVAVELQKFGQNIHWNLMVIPFMPIQAFKEQLAKWKIEGHSLYLHGYRHKADLSLKRNLFGRLALRLTNNEAEFAGLSKDDTKMLLKCALEAWQKLDIGLPKGFVAPAWYGSGIFSSLRIRFSNYSIPFSTAGLPKFIVPVANLCEKIYLKLYSALSFLPTPRIVKHPISIFMP